MAQVQLEARVLRIDDPREHGVEAVASGPVDEGTEELIADPAAVVGGVDVDEFSTDVR